jgi:uncharacterized protein (TIGR02246 family)
MLAGCAKPTETPAPPPPPDAAAMRSAIEARITSGIASFEARDTAAMGKLFADDGVWVLPNGTVFKGHAAITSGAAAFFATMDSLKNDMNTLDEFIVVNDNEVVTFSTWHLTVKEKGKKVESHINQFADYWRKGTDGAWRIVREINAEGPMPAGEMKH